MVVTIDNLSITPFVSYLEATTKGGKSAYRKIEAVESRDACVYTVAPLKAPAIVLPYTEGETINPLELFTTVASIDFTNDGRDTQCPMDKVYTHESEGSTDVV